MNKSYFEEMRKFDHEDEMRYRLLNRGVRLILEDRKQRNKLRRVLESRKRKKGLQAAKWS